MCESLIGKLNMRAFSELRKLLKGKIYPRGERIFPDRFLEHPKVLGLHHMWEKSQWIWCEKKGLNQGPRDLRQFKSWEIYQLFLCRHSDFVCNCKSLGSISSWAKKLPLFKTKKWCLFDLKKICFIWANFWILKAMVFSSLFYKFWLTKGAKVHHINYRVKWGESGTFEKVGKEEKS